ncbi:hypothetical protein L3Q82_010632, partial [Scortum barcoo]
MSIVCWSWTLKILHPALCWITGCSYSISPSQQYLSVSRFTSQRTSPGPSTPHHCPRKPTSASTCLRKLRKARAPAPIMCIFYRGTIESVLTSGITVLYGDCSAICH